jgi:hypothetical protein
MRFARLFVVLVALARLGGSAYLDSFRFVILGDRTGSTVAGVYEQVWREAAANQPAFVVSVGDMIEGGKDATATREWQEVEKILKPYRRFPLYLTPGNHDIWSAVSEQLYRKYSARPPQYSFDHGQAHFTILDSSRSEDLSAAQLDFLERDLKAHAARPVKFVLSHRPSWLVNVALRNPNFALHRIAKKYGVQYVIAGHVHQLLRFDLEDVTYLSMPSSGGHLRNSRKYEDGWFFGHALVEVRGTEIDLQIQELKPPHGQGRLTKPKDWGMLGLSAR